MKNKIIINNLSQLLAIDLENIDEDNLIKRIELNNKLLDCVNTKEECEYLPQVVLDLTAGEPGAC